MSFECNLKAVKSYSSIVLSAEAQKVNNLKKEDQAIEELDAKAEKKFSR